MRYIVEATERYISTNTSDNELSNQKGVRYVPQAGEKWEVSFERKEKLVDLGFVTVIEEVKEEKKETSKAKTGKKTTKKDD